MTKIFYVTDIHGSEICWRKFLNAGPHYGADVVIVGGDVTGKAMVPIVERGGGRWETTLQDRLEVLESEDAVREFETKILNRGYYPIRVSEEQLGERLDAILERVSDPGRTIFNFHAPPHGTGIDEAPALNANMSYIAGGRALRPVGSTSVKAAIQRVQPLLSLHGHIHESKGALRMGSTLVMNPGSSYEEGILQGAIVTIDDRKGKVKSYQLVNG